MNNCHLIDFEAWLDEQESQSSSISQQAWNHHIFLLKTKPENFADFLAGRENFATEEWQPYRQIALKWKTQIDAGQWKSEDSAVAKLKKENRDLKKRLHLHSETGFTNLGEVERLEGQIQETQTKLTTEQKKTQALTLLANSRKEQLEREKQALIKLANKKLTNQREAQKLLKQLTEKWDKEKGEITEELTQTKTTLQKHKEKHNNYLTKEKSLLTKEIKLIKEALHD